MPSPWRNQGADAVRRDPIGFARIQWDTWSPPGWFGEAEFAATAESFTDPDWAAITLSAYRSRWRDEPFDSRYAALQERLGTIESLGTPALILNCRISRQIGAELRQEIGGHLRVGTELNLE